jgi:hypothetical protein
MICSCHCEAELSPHPVLTERARGEGLCPFLTRNSPHATYNHSQDFQHFQDFQLVQLGTHFFSGAILPANLHAGCICATVALVIGESIH